MRLPFNFDQISQISIWAWSGVLAIAILAAIWFLRKRLSDLIVAIKQFRARRQEDAPGAEVSALSSAAPQPFIAHFDRLAAIADRMLTPDLNEFLMEIAQSIRESLPDSTAEASVTFVEEMLDRLDDLRAILHKRTGDEAAAVSDFREAIVRILADCGVELIHSGEWNPALQRAIAKNPVAGITAPTITDFGSTGYFRHGTLRRKQEVVLAIPSTDFKPPTKP
jgi:hypothetical protein